MTRHRITTWTAVLLLATACGGRQDPPALHSLSIARPIALPSATPAVPAFRLSFKKPVTGSLLARVEKAEGIAVAVPLRRKHMKVDSPKVDRTLRVGSAAPLEVRSVVPEPTRAAEFVWTSLVHGDAVLTPEAADRLEVTGSATLRLDRRTTVAVGAFADNAVPNVVDVLVASHIGRKLHLGPPRLLFVGIKPRAQPDNVRAALERIAPQARIKRLSPASPTPQPQPIGRAESGLIGAMTYRILENGFIDPDPAWVAANIVTAEVPILGNVTCHRLLVPQLSAAFAEIERKGLANLIDRDDYGGCFVPRFIGRDPRRGLSMHAFGLAVDLNVSRNHFGTSGDIDGRVVAVFDRWGFAWGGRWSPPDPMHFELARLLAV